MRLNLREYDTTKNYTFADSSRTHKLKIQVDYPVKGNPVFMRRVRTFIMEALEFDLYSGAASMGRYNGDPSNGQAVINYYGVGGVPLLKKRRAAYEWESMEEEKVIKKIAENDDFITFEVTVIIWASSYNAVVNCYGETFRKSDGKKLKIIADPPTSNFKKLLNSYFPGEMKDFMYEPDTDIPIPTTEPYLIQSGVRFVYQKREVTAPEAGYVQEDIPFSEIQQYLTDEVKDVLKGSDSAKTKEIPVRTPNSGNAGNSVKSNHVLEPAKVYDVVDEMPQFPGGSQSMLEYLSKNIKYPVVAEENGVQGRVIVTFVVERDGSITNEKIVKSVDPSLSKEAIRVVKSMPHWIPGRQKGSAVRVKYTVPVTFKLDGSNKEVQNSSVQSRQQYTAWFVFGTKNELMRQNILMNDGTFSKTRLMDSSRDYFTKIDTRIDKEIKLYSKKANVLTSHPSSAYTLRPDENMRYVLRITDPQLFWSTSDYLVIIVE